MGRKKPQTYENFMKSPLYGAFVRFGKHLIDLNALNPIGFIDFLLRIEAPIDKWATQKSICYLRSRTEQNRATHRCAHSQLYVDARVVDIVWT